LRNTPLRLVACFTHPTLSCARSRRGAIARDRRKTRESISKEKRFPPAGRPQPRIAGRNGPFLAAAGDDGQTAVGLHLHHEPVLFHIVPVALAVLLRMHRLGPRARVCAVLGRCVNHTVAGSVHRLRLLPLPFHRKKLAASLQPPLLHHPIRVTSAIQYECVVPIRPIRRDCTRLPQALLTPAMNCKLNATPGRLVWSSGNAGKRRVSEWLAATLEMWCPARGCGFEPRALRLVCNGGYEALGV
jgi:hypothetical protein